MGKTLTHGMDILRTEKMGFGKLLEEISKFNEILSIKYTTSHPLDVDEDLLNARET